MQLDQQNSADSALSQLYAIIEGRVQGVGFRAFVQRNAVIFGLTGWVRNRWNGTVELIAEGNTSTLEDFLAILQRGPFPGTTRKVKTTWHQASGEFKVFRIRETG